MAVTAGYMNEAPRREFFGYMDAANVDLKGFTEEFYRKLTGVHLAPVLETLEYLKHETRVWLELTTLLIPGHNDSNQELEELTKWIVSHLGPDVPLHFSAFHADWKMRDVPSTPPATLTRARRIAIDNGVRYAYTGNVRDEAGQSTYCHNCGAKLIGRTGYTITAWHLNADGMCEKCGTACAGVFEARPGEWGDRRQPVRLASFGA